MCFITRVLIDLIRSDRLMSSSAGAWRRISTSEQKKNRSQAKRAKRSIRSQEWSTFLQFSFCQLPVSFRGGGCTAMMSLVPLTVGVRACAGLGGTRCIFHEVVNLAVLRALSWGHLNREGCSQDRDTSDISASIRPTTEEIALPVLCTCQVLVCLYKVALT